MPHTLPDLANSAEEAPDTTMDLDKSRVNLEDLRRQEKLRKDEEKYETWVVSDDIYPGLSFSVKICHRKMQLCLSIPRVSDTTLFK